MRLIIHSFSTAVIDRQGTLAANLEGNQFTPQQLGDVVPSRCWNKVGTGGWGLEARGCGTGLSGQPPVPSPQAPSALQKSH